MTNSNVDGLGKNTIFWFNIQYDDTNSKDINVGEQAKDINVGEQARLNANPLVLQ